MRIYRWIFVLGLVFGVGALFAVFTNEQQSTAPKPVRSGQIAPEKGPGESGSGSPGSLDESLDRPALDLDSNSAPQIIVDSFPPGRQTQFDDWRRTDEASGHFDRLAVIGEGGVLVDQKIVGAENVLVAQGWAGERQVGIRYKDVLLVMCRLVVARAQVSQDRPDVAEAVHPNLGRSGWEAQIVVADLPLCDDDRLSAWAVVQATPPFLAPLIGSHPVRIKNDRGSAVPHVSAQSPLTPDSYDPLTVVRVEIKASRANLRTCATTACSRVAQIDGGVYPSVILDRVDGWSLIAFSDRIGWLFDDLYGVVK
ncbi:MAG: hypothetical protein ABJ215_00805 [Alphaproteobacteria bacterium]